MFVKFFYTIFSLSCTFANIKLFLLLLDNVVNVLSQPLCNMLLSGGDVGGEEKLFPYKCFIHDSHIMCEESVAEPDREREKKI